jgi:outer membrane lipoprotein-sorting protein
VPILLIVNGSLLTYYDQELDQTSHSSAHNNLIGVLARKNIKFDGDLIVKNITLKAKIITLEIVQRAKDRKDKINLIFNEKPLNIKKIEIIDELGNITSIILNKLQFGLKLDNKLFKTSTLNSFNKK